MFPFRDPRSGKRSCAQLSVGNRTESSKFIVPGPSPGTGFLSLLPWPARGPKARGSAAHIRCPEPCIPLPVICYQTAASHYKPTNLAVAPSKISHKEISLLTVPNPIKLF
ncbi:hypothetical protein KIL84_014287 [Mauremys mutica]|uniref:Uncharacterized protein n=1 Tax=Mauremys mutica TaxID=74926 RepID=A0A9D3XPG4_9SAUR|nr:hypothetical protein KIL84_014287 [Mauremys mutica]